MYVVTDGIETCGGEPVAAAERIAGQGIRPVINVIGFQVGNKEAQELRKIAQAGKGRYTTADSGAALTRYWKEDAKAMMDAWEKWKREALAAIERQGKANMEAAAGPGQRIMEGIETEWKHQEQIVKALKNAQVIDYSTERRLWGELYSRKVAIWGWAYERKTANWSAACEQRTADWANAYDLGVGKWSEYYQKSRGR